MSPRCRSCAARRPAPSSGATRPSRAWSAADCRSRPDSRPSRRRRHPRSDGRRAVGRATSPTPTRALRDRLVVHYTPLVRAVAHRVGSRPAGLRRARRPGAVRRLRPDRRGRAVRPGALPAVRELRRAAHPRRDPRRAARPGLGAAQRPRPGPRAGAGPGAAGGRLQRARDRPRAGRGARRAGARAARAHPECSWSASRRWTRAAAGSRSCSPTTTRPTRWPWCRPGRRCGSSPRRSAQLGERDRTVLRLYYLENRTLAEIGRLLGVTESRVCQLHSRLVGRLRGRLEELAAG